MAATWKKQAFADDHPLKATLAAEGSMYVASEASVPAELAIGSPGDVLTVTGGTAVWAAPGALGDHADTHKNGGDDELMLHELGEPIGAISINGQQMTDMVLENSDTDPTPVLGKIYFKTGDATPYICTSIEA